METILLAADVYEHGPELHRQEWESSESINLLQESLRELGYDVVVLEKQTEITHFILDFIERKNPSQLIVFNLIEGYQSRNREGYIPSLCEYLGVCYTGSDAYAQNVSLDKFLIKMIATDLGIPTPSGMLLREVNLNSDLPLSFPVFIKPNAEGSSLGITEENIVRNKNEFYQVANKLLPSFGDLLVEDYIPGEDLTLGILGHPGNYELTDVARIQYDSTVYSESVKSKEAMPEKLIFDLHPELNVKARDYGLLLANYLKILGPARFDFRLHGQNLYLLELNLTPGLSKIYSTLPIAWQHSGRNYQSLLKSIIVSAQWRYLHRKEQNYGKRNYTNG